MIKIDFDRQLLKKLAPSLFIFALLLFLLPVLLLPRLRQTLNLKLANQQNQAYLVRLVSKATTLENFSLPVLQTRMAVSLTALPPEKDVPRLISTVDKVAGDSGVAVVSFSLAPGIVATQSGQKEESFSLKYTLAGSWENLGNFFTKIDAVLPLLAVEKIKLANSAGQFQAEVDLKTFTLNLPEKLGPVDEPVMVLTKEEEKSLVDLDKFTAYSFPLQEATPAGKPNPFAF